MIVVTSFHAKDWDNYAKRMVESFVKYWPEDIKLFACVHDGAIPDYSNERVLFYNLSGDPYHAQFYQLFGSLNGADPQAGGQYNYRFDAAKFSHKVLALYAALRQFEEAIIWLDADTETTFPVSKEDLSLWLPSDHDISFLNRTAINYAETSFIGFNNTKPARELLGDLVGAFLSGEFVNYREWHDGFVFTRLLMLHCGHGLAAWNLSDDCKDLDAFGSSPLGVKMKHYKGNQKPQQRFPQQLNQSIFPIMIAPRDSVDSDDLMGNVESNKRSNDRWISYKFPHDGVGIVASAGPSLKKNIQELKDLIKRTVAEGRKPYVFCVKHSYKLLLDNGVQPDLCVLLDPRPFDEESTTGHVRSDLIRDPDPSTLFAVATICNPAVKKYLESQNAKIINWNAWTNGIKSLKLEFPQFFITGGTCAAMRAISMGFVLGFREFHLFGFDACVYEEVDTSLKLPDGNPKWIELGIKMNGVEKKVTTSGEWLALAQDYERLLKDVVSGKLDLDLNVHGEDGLIYFVHQSIVGNLKKPPKTKFEGTL